MRERPKLVNANTATTIDMRREEGRGWGQSVMSNVKVPCILGINHTATTIGMLGEENGKEWEGKEEYEEREEDEEVEEE